jgi:tRNA threonylcarbamoyladenosine biosynthesis protein TsaB
MTDKRFLVAIDTATRFAGLALYDGEMVYSELYWRSDRNHSVELMPTLVQMLDRQKLSAADLSVVAVALGPGSFTGLRIGLSTAKGLAQACDLPILGVPTLDILAFQHSEQRRPIWAVIQAGRGRLCVARYERRRGRWQQRGQIQLTTLDGFVEMIAGRCLICGELDDKEVAQITERTDQDIVIASPSKAMRRPACLAELAWHRFVRGDSDELATLSPIYIHPVS